MPSNRPKKIIAMLLFDVLVLYGGKDSQQIFQPNTNYGSSLMMLIFSELFLPEGEKLSLKAFLATEQRIPGLGNRVLQDILYNAKLHPKRKVASLDSGEKGKLFSSIKDTLNEMTRQGGRDTERDLFGEPAGYATRVSKNTVGKPCPQCDSLIMKEAYMGGSIYYCPGCQKVS